MGKITSEGYGIQTLLEGNFTQLIEYDGSDRPLYIGVTEPGNTTDQSRWCIKRLSYSATNQVTKIEFANGTNQFDKIWDNRASYTYPS